ncbi:hypothetical protein HZH66_013752 [Vespula vulgaris]|uniref:Uncharacterized protein n=1 Tax=Vespula vulgaris TaxID=7454 RepID=A0A834J3P3_VESVU|nr:hypothetical protein HZH66_013752 [Vespula vulgaris]
MDTSPTLSIGGSRARAALLTTSGTGSGGTDRRVVFLTSQTVDGSGHETKTWPHHWSPHTNRVESRGVSRQCLVAPRDYIGMFRLNDIHPVPSRRYLNKRRRGGGGGGARGGGGAGRGGGRGTGSGKGLQ